MVRQLLPLEPAVRRDDDSSCSSCYASDTFITTAPVSGKVLCTSAPARGRSRVAPMVRARTVHRVCPKHWLWSWSAIDRIHIASPAYGRIMQAFCTSYPQPVSTTAREPCEVRRACSGPGLRPGPRRQARWVGRGLRRSRVGPEDRFCEAVRNDLRVPLTQEGPTRTMRGIPTWWL